MLLPSGTTKSFKISNEKRLANLSMDVGDLFYSSNIPYFESFLFCISPHCGKIWIFSSNCIQSSISSSKEIWNIYIFVSFLTVQWITFNGKLLKISVRVPICQNLETRNLQTKRRGSIKIRNRVLFLPEKDWFYRTR